MFPGSRKSIQDDGSAVRDGADGIPQDGEEPGRGQDIIILYRSLDNLMHLAATLAKFAQHVTDGDVGEVIVLCQPP